MEWSDDSLIEVLFWQFAVGAEKSHENTLLQLSAFKCRSNLSLKSYRYTSLFGDRCCPLIHCRSSLCDSCLALYWCNTEEAVVQLFEALHHKLVSPKFGSQ